MTVSASLWHCIHTGGFALSIYILLQMASYCKRATVRIKTGASIRFPPVGSRKGLYCPLPIFIGAIRLTITRHLLYICLSPREDFPVNLICERREDAMFQAERYSEQPSKPQSQRQLKRAIAVSITLLLFTANLFAAPPRDDKKLKAEEVIARHLEAIGSAMAHGQWYCQSNSAAWWRGQSRRGSDDGLFRSTVSLRHEVPLQ